MARNFLELVEAYVDDKEILPLGMHELHYQSKFRYILCTRAEMPNAERPVQKPNCHIGLGAYSGGLLVRDMAGAWSWSAEGQPQFSIYDRPCSREEFFQEIKKVEI